MPPCIFPLTSGSGRGIEFAGCDFGRLDILGRFDCGYAENEVLRWADFRGGLSMRPDRQYREAMGQRDVVADLILLCLG